MNLCKSPRAALRVHLARAGTTERSRSESACPGAALQAHTEPSKDFSLGFKAFRSQALARPGRKLPAEAFAGQSPPSVGALEREGSAGCGFPRSDSFVFLSSLAPRGARWGRKGTELAAEPERKGKESLEAPWRGRRDGGGSECANSLVRAGGLCCLGAENLINQSLCCIQGILPPRGGAQRRSGGFSVCSSPLLTGNRSVGSGRLL